MPPKPTPTALKVLRNNPGRRPINHDEPQPEALDDAVPDELTDVEARREWTRTIVPTIAIGQITEAERTLAIAHCDLWATWRAQIALAAQGAHVITAGKNGYPMPNPARVQANKTLLLLIRIDETLGLSPTTRSRVTKVYGRSGKPSAAGRQHDRFFGGGGGGA